MSEKTSVIRSLLAPLASGLGLVASAALLPVPADAQATGKIAAASRSLKTSGSVRLRYENLSGQFRPGFEKSEDAVLLRTILTAEYDAGQIKVGGEVWDSRAYSGEGAFVGTGEVNTAELVQAYLAADLKEPLGAGSKGSTQLGRMTLNLGSRRLIASDDYRNTTNSFTGLKLDLQMGPAAATLLYLLPQRRLPEDLPSILDNEWEIDRESFDQRLWGGLVSHKLDRIGTLEGTFLRYFERDHGKVSTRDRRLNTFGARVIRDPAPRRFNYELELIRQTGSIAASVAPNAPKMPVRAGFAHAELGYTFAGTWRPHLSLEFDWSSGDGPGRHYTRFDTLYGMRRADLGPASLYAALGRANISTPGVRLEVAPSKRLDAFGSWRALWSDEPGDVFSTTGLRNRSGGSRYAGQQVEGRVRYWLLPSKVRAEANVAFLVRDGFLGKANNAPTNRNSVYTSLALTAAF